TASGGWRQAPSVQPCALNTLLNSFCHFWSSAGDRWGVIVFLPSKALRMPGGFDSMSGRLGMRPHLVRICCASPLIRKLASSLAALGCGALAFMPFLHIEATT